jgi:hypothetical protein
VSFLPRYGRQRYEYERETEETDEAVSEEEVAV